MSDNTQHGFSARDAALAQWIAHAALQDDRRDALLQRYCEKLVEIGVPLLRLHLAQAAINPQYGGLGFSWLRQSGLDQDQYQHRDSPSANWLRSPLFYILAHDLPELRLDPKDPADADRFPVLHEIATSGGTDYVAARVLMEAVEDTANVDPLNPPFGGLISWATDAPGGFAPQDLQTIRNTLPFLGLALKSGANRRTLQDLLAVYLGSDPGQRVLSGEIRRGSLQQTHAAILLFDLTGFTRMTEDIPAPEVISLLNAYFGRTVEAITQKGGHVLKFMGDGLLAIFNTDDPTRDANAALAVAQSLQATLPDLSAARRARNLPATDYTLALHAGDILYGNIGGENRLDFTVIGAAVNQTARISGMHRPLGQRVIVSDTLRQAAGPRNSQLVGLGRYMLRGIPTPQDLFTIYTPG